MDRIGIIAGGGQFPFLVAQGAKEKGYAVFAVGFEGNTDPSFTDSCDEFLLNSLGQLNALIKFFKHHEVTQICMAGAISKPKAMDFKPDFRAAKLLFKLAGSRGDDAILRVVAEELTSEGFEIVKPEVLVPSLLTNPVGILAGPEPSPEVWADLAFGWQKAKELGALDIGQSVAVRDRVVVAVEAVEGTDNLITRAGQLTSAGLCFVKVLKPSQDERVDKPSLGSRTIELLAQYKYTAVAFESDKTLFFDRDESLKMANSQGISIVSVPAGAEAFFADKTNK